MNSRWEFVRKLLNLICHMLIAIHVYVLWWHYVKETDDHYNIRKAQSSNMKLKFDLTTAHALMSGTGIAFFIPEGLLLFCPTNYTNTLSSRTQRILNLFWFISGFLLILAASLITLAKYAFHGGHVITGIIALILLIISAIFGIMMISSSIRNRRSIRLCYYILGIIGYIIGIVSLIYAYHRISCSTCRLYNIEKVGDIFLRTCKECSSQTINSGGICGHKWQMMIALIGICVISLIAPIEILLNRHEGFH